MSEQAEQWARGLGLREGGFADVLLAVARAAPEGGGRFALPLERLAADLDADQTDVCWALCGLGQMGHVRAANIGPHMKIDLLMREEEQHGR